MLVQALTAFAENRLKKQLHDVAFEERPVPYFLELNGTGRFLGMISRFEAVPSKAKPKAAKAAPAPKQRAMLCSVPRFPGTLTSGIYALLGVGELKYVLGAGPWSQKPARDTQCLQAFVDRLRQAQSALHLDVLSAVLHFYGSEMEMEKARETFRAAVPGSYVALSFQGRPLTDMPIVQRWWQEFYETESSGRADVEGECLITGSMGPIPRTHPQIKHTTNIGGKAGVALMSFNAPAFTSYGWEQNANSPVCAEAALKYTMALNELLKPGSAHRKDDGETAYLFWLSRDGMPNPMEALESRPNAGAIQNVERLLETKQAWLNPTLFHLVALSANGSRLIVRSALTELLPVVFGNVLAWWNGLSMQTLERGKEPATPAWWQMKFALDRKGEPPDGLMLSLRMRALLGTQRPLGAQILHDVLGRMRVDKSKRLDLAALGLLRICLNDDYEAQGKERPMSAALNQAELQRHPAYICGRLLALHDSLQYRTFDLAGEPQPNATVADRFYTLAMNSPSVGMATVFNLGRKHLSKLRRLPKRQPKMPGGGAPIAFAYEQMIANIREDLQGSIPTNFNLQDKAHFALGFYHQKAYRPKKTSDATSVDEVPAEAVSAKQTTDMSEPITPNETSFYEETEQ